MTQHAAEDIGAVVPYTLVTESSDLALIDVDAKIMDSSRTRYATFVKDIDAAHLQFQSPSLFAEAIVREVQCRETTTPAMRVAAATWALEVLSSQPGQETLRNIRNILMPALYIGFNDVFDPKTIPGSARSILVDTSVAVVAQNVFLTNDLYADQYLSRYQETMRTTQMTTKLQQLGVSKKGAIFNMTEALATQRVAFAFRAWRVRTRSKRLERCSRGNRIVRRDESARQLVLQNCFSVWKSHVERSRSVFLSERLHNAASQLENAKNQFQLQCFRSDKHLFTVEELRSELYTIRKDYDTLLEQKRELEKTLRDYEVESTKKLNHHVNSVLAELNSWRRFSRRCVEGLAVHDEIVKKLEEQQAGSQASNSDDEQQPTLSPSQEPVVAHHNTGKRKSGAGALSSPTANDGTSHDMSGTSEDVLLSWVQSVLISAPLTPSTTTVSNFSTDFQSGEVMLLVLHSVFPNDVPLTPLQEATVAKRLERLVASFMKCGVAVVPSTSDFLDCNSDVIFIVLAELFGRNLQLQSLRKAKELTDGSYTGLEETLTSQIEYTQEMLPSILESSKMEIAGLIQQENLMRQQSSTLLKWQEAVGRDAAFATRERMSGNPVRAIGKTVVEKYWKFRVGRYSDLEPKYRIKDEGWKDHLVGSLRKVLQKHVHTTSRLFFRFSWSATTMNEVHFWRIAHVFKFAEKPMTPQAVEKIFSQVVKNTQHNPDLQDGPENVLLQEIAPQDFIEVLIRLADAKYTAKSLPDRVDQLLQAVHKMSAGASTSNPAMQQYLYSDASQKVLDRFMVDVVRIYLFYAKRLSRGQNYARLLSYVLHIDHLMQLLEDLGAVPGEGNGAPFVTQPQVLSVLKVISAQDDGSILSEFSFHHFMELLGSLSGYRTPDPLVPVATKLEIMLTTLINRIRARNKGSSLVVSDVRIASVV
jgi:hypothetical protein